MGSNLREPLWGQTALVTGASRGIGRAIALHLGALGARVAVNYHRQADAAEQTVHALAASGAPAPFLCQANVADPAQAAQLVEDVVARAGPIDIVINNAGIQRSGMAHRMSDDDWHDVIAVNLSAVFFVCRAVLPAMRVRGRGHIVNIASASSFVAQPGAASYVASKHGLIGLTKALALENAAKDIRINAVAPGLTDTDMVSGLSDEQRHQLQQLVPMGRLGDPAEVASAVGWLVAESAYTTGNTLHVSGGVVLG